MCLCRQAVLNDPSTGRMLSDIQSDPTRFDKSLDPLSAFAHQRVPRHSAYRRPAVFMRRFASDPRIGVLVRAGILEAPPHYRLP